jgi:hypothetical protein
LIDSFIESISKPIAQPILQTHNSAGIGLQNLQASLQSCPAKRQSTRLAQKTANNVGKDTVQIAHELLVKKLGDLSGETQEHISDDFEFYAQHFARPMERNTMEAIQGLIEQAYPGKKTGLNLLGAAGAPVMLA